MISRRTLGVAVIAVLPLVAACGAGRNTTTDRERQTPYVASASAGPMFLTAAVLVPSQSTTSGTSTDTLATPSSSPGSTDSASASPTPTPSESSTPSASSSGTPSPSASASASASSGSSAQAYLVVTIFNRGAQPDRLAGAIVRGASVTPSDTSDKALTVQPQRALRFVDPELGSTGTALAVSGFTQPIERGSAVPVTFQFANSGSVTLAVPVRTAETFGTTATSTPLPLTGSYPSASEEPEGRPSGG